MSEEGKNENENDNGQNEGSVNIYDDNAYMFGEEPSENNSEEKNEMKEINKLDYINYNEEFENEGINAMESKELYKDYDKELDNNNSKNNHQEIEQNSIQKENINSKMNNISKGENINNSEKKYRKKLKLKQII